MKKIESEYIFNIALIVFICMFTIYSLIVTTISMGETDKKVNEFFNIPADLKGKTEFYYTPNDDNRVWHVINKYNSAESKETLGYNMSEYTFSKDSVNVINQISGIPDLTNWEISLAGLY